MSTACQDLNRWKKERLLLKKLPGFTISWVEQFIVATVCWRSEVCKQIYFLFAALIRFVLGFEKPNRKFSMGKSSSDQQLTLSAT